jgi:hypothetical protein
MIRHRNRSTPDVLLVEKKLWSQYVKTQLQILNWDYAQATGEVRSTPNFANHLVMLIQHGLHYKIHMSTFAQLTPSAVFHARFEVPACIFLPDLNFECKAMIVKWRPPCSLSGTSEQKNAALHMLNLKDTCPTWAALCSHCLTCSCTNLRPGPSQCPWWGNQAWCWHPVPW